MARTGYLDGSYESLQRGYVAAEIGETLANYRIYDEKIGTTSEERSRIETPYRLFSVEAFWDQLFLEKKKGITSAKKCEIRHKTISEWVPRIPGLFFRQSRNAHPLTLSWGHFTPGYELEPLLESIAVTKIGVGTLRFPPDDGGFRLVSLTDSEDASAGVPALISPDIWDGHELAEGRVVARALGEWRAMPHRWSERFAYIADIPRGCIVIDDAASFDAPRDVYGKVVAHPFSIMEYWDGNTQLHDFIFATAETTQPDFRGEVATFFETCRSERNRQGVYLTAADIGDPLWEATFASPEEMRGSKAAQLRLIERRIEDVARGSNVVDALLARLSNVASREDLSRLSLDADIDWRLWSKGGLITEEAARLVDVAAQRGRMKELLYAVHSEGWR